MPVKPIAYYLPQFHPIPENDSWWGKGFTEWTNVAKAKPFFEGHYQPRLPADLGFYDLRVPEVREAQAEMARKYGVYGFCYYHYWFGNGKRLLERPFNEVLASGKPDFPFMLCWANQTWKGVWFGAQNDGVLIEQLYPGKQDYINHFQALLPAFVDPRYITIDGMPVFQIYKPDDVPDLSLLTDTLRECALRAGLKGLYLMAGFTPRHWNPLQHDFDGMVGSEFNSRVYYKAIQKQNNFWSNVINRGFAKESSLFSKFRRAKPIMVEYEKAIPYLISEANHPYDYFPCAVNDWDNTPRAGINGTMLTNSNPDLWRIHFRQAMQKVRNYSTDRQIVFIKSWNEWAEGNCLEPDVKWGTAYLEVVQSELSKNY